MRVILIMFLLFGVAWLKRLKPLTCPCGKRNTGRIVDGKETKRNEYPWMVAVQTSYDSFTFCGGTIITPWHVVTAAHCVRDYRPSDLQLVVGAHDVQDLTDSTSYVVFVDQILVHPEHDRTTKTADIALLVTSTEMIFVDPFIGPACMPSRRMIDELKHKWVKAMGWGRYIANQVNNDKVKKLREVDLEVIDVRNCKKANGKKICTFAPHKSTCKGDSGGPVVWLDPDTNRFTLVGIPSTAPIECGNTTRPSMQTNVSYYKDWVNTKITETKRNVKACRKK